MPSDVQVFYGLHVCLKITIFAFVEVMSIVLLIKKSTLAALETFIKNFYYTQDNAGTSNMGSHCIGDLTFADSTADLHWIVVVALIFYCIHMITNYLVATHLISSHIHIFKGIISKVRLIPIISLI